MIRDAILIPARARSTRIPGKLVTPFGGVTALEFLTRRLQRHFRSLPICLCTTTEAADDGIVRFAEANGLAFFRGHSVDIVQRLEAAAIALGAEFLVNVDGDDLFCDTSLIDKAFAILHSRTYDVVHFPGLPLGAAPLAFTSGALHVVVSRKDAIDTQTGWGRLFLHCADFKVFACEFADRSLYRADIRMTLDYDEDRRFFEAIIERHTPDQEISLRSVIAAVDAEPTLRLINAARNEEYWLRFNALAVNPRLKAE